MPENAPEELRKHADQLEKDLATSQAALEVSLGENRKHNAETAFTDAGFDAKFADLYLGTVEDGEITSDAISTWAGTYGLEPSGEPKTEEAPKETQATESPESSTGLEAMGRGGSSPGGGKAPVTDETMTVQAWQELYDKDPDAAKQAVTDGKIQLRKANPFVKDFKQRTNPYLDERQAELTE